MPPIYDILTVKNPLQSLKQSIRKKNSGKIFGKKLELFPPVFKRLDFYYYICNMEKVCTKCNVLKDITDYYKVMSNSDKYRNICKTCTNATNKKWGEENKERKSKVSKIWCQNNKEKRRISSVRRYHEDPEKHRNYHLKWEEKNPNYKKEYNEKNKEVLSIKNKEYRESKKDILNENSRKWYRENSVSVNQRVKEYKKRVNYIKTRKQNDPFFKLKHSIRNSIRMALLKRGYSKKSKTATILGCSFEDFKTLIVSKWEPWMTWENYGLYNGDLNYGWDLDHIIPLSRSKTEDEVLKHNHYSNFQPLCSYKNRVLKRDKLEWND